MQCCTFSINGTMDQILLLFQFISNGFNKPRSGSWTILATINFSKTFDFIQHPTLFCKLFRLTSLLALLVGLNISFLIGALAQLFKITRVVSFESVEVFGKGPLLALYFFLFSSMISLLLCLLPLAVLFRLTIWPSGPPPSWFLLRWGPHKDL